MRVNLSELCRTNGLNMQQQQWCLAMFMLIFYHLLCAGRFLYSDIQPLSELGIAPDLHPEGPSSLPAEAPADIRKELASDRRREGLRKAAVSTRLPRLTQVCAVVNVRTVANYHM